MIRLDDGSLGILPEEWLRRYVPLAGLGEAREDRLRFSRNQLGFLDALLAEQPEVDADALFAKARKQLTRSARVASGVRADLL